MQQLEGGIPFSNPYQIRLNKDEEETGLNLTAEIKGEPTTVREKLKPPTVERRMAAKRNKP